jgi:hypothetical protein
MPDSMQHRTTLEIFAFLELSDLLLKHFRFASRSGTTSSVIALDWPATAGMYLHAGRIRRSIIDI